jgi:hypothetical protein
VHAYPMLVHTIALNMKGYIWRKGVL